MHYQESIKKLDVIEMIHLLRNIQNPLFYGCLICLIFFFTLIISVEIYIKTNFDK
jgi:hypothetical protein